MTPSDLRALAARVEAGENVPEFELRKAGNYGPQDIAFWGLPDSLDACLSLHEAVLGERWACQVCIDLGYGSIAMLDPDEATAVAIESNAPIRGDAPTPARAWLAAILRALAVEREAADDPA